MTGSRLPASRSTAQPFDRARRLGDSTAFTRALRSRQRVSNAHFVASWQPGAGAVPRLGLTVGRRAVPRATARNRVKRALREAFRRRAALLPVIDVVVLARPGCGMLRDRDLASSAAELFERLLERCERA